MSDINSFSHLTLMERRIILTGITIGSSKTASAQTIGKDNSTVGKEIKLHRTLSHKCNIPLKCSAYRKCVHRHQCTPNCPEYVPFRCSRWDRSSNKGFLLTRYCKFTPNWGFLKRQSTTMSKTGYSTGWPTFQHWTCAGRSHARSSKRRHLPIKKG